MNITIISVIVPVYNAEATIDRCIDSIIAQTFSDWELILVDDGSSDGSGQRCKARVSENPRIKYIHKENGGVSSARNRGIDEAQGDYIMFVDSDDWIEPDALETMYRAAQEYGAEIVIPRMKQVHYAADGSFLREVFHGDDFDLLTERETIAEHFEKLFQSWAIFSSQGTLYQRSFLIRQGIRFDPKISVLEDFCFNLDCLRKVNKLYHINYVAYTFYVFDLENYKYKRNYEKTIDGIRGTYDRLMRLLREKEIVYLPAYANFLLSYWIQVIQIVEHSNLPVFRKYAILRTVGSACRSQELLSHCDRNAIEMQYYLLFKTASPTVYYFISICKEARNFLKEKKI